MLCVSSDGTPKVYLWDLDAPGPSGVSVAKGRAIERLNEALYDVPAGVKGWVTEARLTAFGEGVGYEPIRDVAKAIRDEHTGLIVWTIPKDASRPEPGRVAGRDAHHAGPPE